MTVQASLPQFVWLSAALCLVHGCGEASAAPERGGPPPAQVQVATGREGTLRVERTYLGTVRALARAELAAGADGEVTEVNVSEGDRVEAGQVLLRVDPDLAAADLRAARAADRRTRARENQAGRDARRFAAAGPRIVGEVEIERAASEADALSAEAENSRATLARARATLARHHVVAPFDGVIAARSVDPGDWVSPGTPVLELVGDARTEILVRVEPELLESVSVGSEATVSRAGREATARVMGVVPALDPRTRTAQLRLVTADATPWLLPGSTVDVGFVIERGGEGIIVPRDALVDGVAESRVVRVADGRAEPITVRVVERAREEVRVSAEGLGADDVLVVRGNDRLRPGQPLQVVE